MKLGVNLAALGDRSLARALDFVGALGVDTVELNAEGTDPLTPLASLTARGGEVRQAVRDRGLTISALGNHGESQLIGGPWHADTDGVHRGDATEKRRWGTERLLATARAASELEVDTVIGFVGCEDWSRYFPWPAADGWEQMIEPFVETWSPILDEFGRLGVRFAHEPHPKQLVFNLETAVAVTRALGERAEWGFNLDTGNLLLAGVDPAAFVQELGPHIFHVHAKDLEFVQHNLARSGWQSHGPWNRPDRGVRFRVPGWGDVPWKRVISELQLCGYRGSLSVEHEDPTMGREEGLTQGIRHLERVVLRDPPEEQWW